MNSFLSKHAPPIGRSTGSQWRRRRFRSRSAQNFGAASEPRSPVWLSGVAFAALVIIMLLGVGIAAALVATALTVVVAQGWQEQAAALIPLALSALIFTGLGGLLRRWMRPSK